MKTEKVTLSVSDGSKMDAYVTYPDSSVKMPGLMIFQEAFGVNDHIKDMTRRFAEEGYVAIAPELYHRTAPAGFTTPYDEIKGAAAHREAMTYETIGQDIVATGEWLKQNEKVNDKKIASVGYCMGGRVSFYANVAVPLQAAVSYYGGGIAKDLLNKVKTLHAPILFIWGGADKHIPREDRSEILNVCDREKKKYISIEFSDAGHGFSCDERASYHGNATQKAWDLTLSFLKENLQ